MRLHHLSITAFGPFASTVEVDFDELAEAGLFLLTGATGAGKTSILDAVCFALYGQVPGDRAGAKHLRSDHAAPQTAPSVTLRFSVGEREFLFRRAPAWSRPKLRGTGETRVQAQVLVEEKVGGAWTTRTHRLDDAGLLVTHLLGMTCTQFTQVAMLPQGRFQAFLRASSAERHAVLQQLFRTDRFERVERWLVERRVTARRASDARLEEVAASINRLREAAGTDDELDWTEDLDTAIHSGVVAAWTGATAAAAADGAATAQEQSARADAALGAADRALAEARRTADLQARGRRAEEELAALDARRSEVATAAERLTRYQQALPLAALVGNREQARATAREAAERWQLQRAPLLDRLGADVTRVDLARALRHAHAAHDLAVAFGPRARDRSEAVDRMAAARARLQSLEATVAELDVTLSTQPAQIKDAVAAVHEARAAAARQPVVAAAVERLAELVAAARRAELVGLELVAARTEVLAATETAQQLRERYLDVREARINGMAGELAGQLASGCSCPVCGSAEHPAPATSTTTGAGRAEEDHARKAAEDAAFELQARQVGLATLESEAALLDERLQDVDRGALPGRLAEAQDETERLDPLVAALDVLVAREAECRARLLEAEQTRSAALLDRAAISVEIDQISTQLTTITDAWEALLAVPGAAPDEDPAGGLDALIRTRAAQVDLLEQAADDYDAWHRSTVRAEEAQTALAAAATDAGFASVEAALAALLGEADAAAAAAVVAEAEAGRRRAEEVLADPDVAAALAAAVPDTVALTGAYDAAVRQARTAASARDAAAARTTRVGELVGQTTAQVESWLPLYEEYRTVAGLASLVEGKSVDNPLRMRLAAYVLASRLRQVVAAANERLAGMTDQRYALEHTDDRGFGEQRGGLSLRVRDDWNGVDRDPATLSGGETFVVSLALALGLADTVAHEAGGTDIDTLFIDEGFGSLDADTLEDVMDTLDSLRDGGRVVGLVSHVPELRSRITTQLEVRKGRTGSTVRAAFAHA